VICNRITTAITSLIPQIQWNPLWRKVVNQCIPSHLLLHILQLAILILLFGLIYTADDNIQPNQACGLGRAGSPTSFAGAFAFSLETCTTVGYKLPNSVWRVLGSGSAEGILQVKRVGDFVLGRRNRSTLGRKISSKTKNNQNFSVDLDRYHEIISDTIAASVTYSSVEVGAKTRTQESLRVAQPPHPQHLRAPSP
jgi:hypothetical protein